MTMFAIAVSMQQTSDLHGFGNSTLTCLVLGKKFPLFWRASLNRSLIIKLRLNWNKLAQFILAGTAFGTYGQDMVDVWPGYGRYGQDLVDVWPGYGRIWPGSGRLWPGNGRCGQDMVAIL